MTKAFARRLLTAAFLAAPLTAAAADAPRPIQPPPCQTCESPAAPQQVYVQCLICEMPAPAWERLAADVLGAEKAESQVVLNAERRAAFDTACRRAAADGALEVLSRPQLLLDNDQTGFFQVGQPIPTGQGAIQGFAQTGIALRVTPRILGSGRVRMAVRYQHAAPFPVAAGVRTVHIQEDEFCAEIPDGQSAVVAGPVRKPVGAATTVRQVLVLTGHVVTPGKVPARIAEEADRMRWTYRTVTPAVPPIPAPPVAVASPVPVQPLMLVPPPPVPVAAVPFAQPLRPLPVAPPLSGPTVATEICTITVPAGFCEKTGLFEKAAGADGKPAAFLSEQQALRLLEAVQADRRASIVQAPKLNLPSGVPGTIFVGDVQKVTTAVEVRLVDGKPMALAKTEDLLVPSRCDPNDGCAVKLSLQTTASADRRFVRLAVGGELVWRGGPDELIPVTHPITPVFEGGSQGQPVPFTTHIQKPNITRHTVNRTAAVPAGGTMAVLVGRRTVTPCQESSVLGKLPYLNVLFKNVCCESKHVTCEPRSVEQEVLVLVTPRVICNDDAPPAPPAAVRLTAAVEPACPACAACAACCEKTTPEVTALVAAYRAACAAGKTEEAMKYAMQALAKDPQCFAGK